MWKEEKMGKIEIKKCVLVVYTLAYLDRLVSCPKKH
jgi:hypothetical protein